MKESLRKVPPEAELAHDPVRLGESFNEWIEAQATFFSSLKENQNIHVATTPEELHSNPDLNKSVSLFLPEIESLSYNAGFPQEFMTLLKSPALIANAYPLLLMEIPTVTTRTEQKDVLVAATRLIVARRVMSYQNSSIWLMNSAVPTELKELVTASKPPKDQTTSLARLDMALHSMAETRGFARQHVYEEQLGHHHHPSDDLPDGALARLVARGNSTQGESAEAIASSVIDSMLPKK